MRIAGPDTMKLIFRAPHSQVTEISKDLVKKAVNLQVRWNKHCMGFMPYCYTCLVPLDWFDPHEGGVIFECPWCGRQWAEDDSWEDWDA